MAINKEKRVENFLNRFERYVERYDDPIGSFLFVKRDGTKINFSFSKEFEGQNKDYLRELLGNLYPYYVKKDELPLSALGYLFNEDNPKEPIVWPPSKEYFVQFIRFLNRDSYVGQFRKVEKEINGTKKLEDVGKKLVTIKPTNTLDGPSVLD